MAEITKEIIIQANQDKVWKIVADFGGVGAWNPEMFNVRLTSDVRKGDNHESHPNQANRFL